MGILLQFAFEMLAFARPAYAGVATIGSDFVVTEREIRPHIVRFALWILGITTGLVLLNLCMLLYGLGSGNQGQIAWSGIRFGFIAITLRAAMWPLIAYVTLAIGLVRGLSNSLPRTVNVTVNPVTVVEELSSAILHGANAIRDETIRGYFDTVTTVVRWINNLLLCFISTTLFCYFFEPKPEDVEQILWIVFLVFALFSVRTMSSSFFRNWVMLPVIVVAIAWLAYTIMFPQAKEIVGIVKKQVDACIKTEKARGVLAEINPLKCFKGEERAVPGADEIVPHYYGIPAPDPKNPDVFIPGPCIRAGLTVQVRTNHPERVMRSTITPVGGKVCTPGERCAYLYAEMLAKILDYSPEEIQQIAEDPNRSWTEGIPDDAPQENLNMGWFINPDSPGPATVTVRFRPSDLC